MKTVTLPEAVLFGTMIGLGVTGFLLAKETRPWYIYILLALVNCIISILACAGTDALAAWLGGMTMTVIGVLCLLAARYVLLAHLSTRSDDDCERIAR